MKKRLICGISCGLRIKVDLLKRQAKQQTIYPLYWPVSALPGVNTDSSFLMGASCSLELSRQQTSSPANLTGADLRGTDIDFSCYPLWCGSLGLKADKRLACQLAYHLCSMQCDDAEYIKMRNSILGFANKFHRVDECGELKPIKEEVA